MSEETDIKRKKYRTAIFLLIMVAAIYITVILKEW
ncbi:hypothetical protein SAMN05428977_101656 [Nitrosomonas sp. Nm166]|nr:hypothetical protein SAMN05428977_101656 [Nitrosomonas sp. Nm166]